MYQRYVKRILDIIFFSPFNNYMQSNLPGCGDTGQSQVGQPCDI